MSYRRWQNSPSKQYDLKGHMGAVYACKLSSCLLYVVSASADKSVRLWKLTGGKCLLTYFGHTKRVTGCDIHPHFLMDSKLCMVVSCSGDRTLRLWSSTDERCLRVLRGHEEAVYRCSFSPDGRYSSPPSAREAPPSRPLPPQTGGLLCRGPDRANLVRPRGIHAVHIPGTQQPRHRCQVLAQREVPRVRL